MVQPFVLEVLISSFEREIFPWGNEGGNEAPTKTNFILTEYFYFKVKF